MAGENENDDNVTDFAQFLSEGEEEQQEEKDETESEVEVEEPEEESEEKETKESKESKEEKIDSSKLPVFKEVTKKYPNLFKDFPNLRHAFFHAKEYRELFPTVDDAREAMESLEGFKSLEEALTRGEPDDTIKVFKSINELGDEALSNLSNNFLPSLKKMDQNLYYQVITPELVNFTRSMFNAGLRNENDNLKNAALVAAQHFFGDQKVASGDKEIKVPGTQKETKKDDKLERDRQNFKQERYTSFYNDVVGASDSQLLESINEGLDPKNVMTSGVKELIAEKVAKEISKTLSNDSIHVSRINSLWKKANNDNFSNSWKSKIVSAYLEAASEIMPRIRAKVRANVLGIRERSSDKTSENSEKRVEPKSTVGGGGQSSGKNGKVDSKKIDWRKTSDLDFLKDNITLKS